MYTPVPKDYYSSLHWRQKRREALAYRNYTCAACGTYWGSRMQFMLDVHHTKKAYQSLWHENVSDLFCLCNKRAPKKCHKRGAYEAFEIRSDRTANWYINIANRLVSWSWRAARSLARWVWRKCRRGPPSQRW